MGLGGERRGGWRGRKTFQPIVPTKNLCKGKKKKTGIEKKKLKEGGQKKRFLLLQSKEDELDRVLIRRLSPDSTIGSLYRLQ